MSAHADRVPAARLVPLPADGIYAPKALFNPVAAGIQGGLRLRYGRVSQQYPGLRLTVGLKHDKGAVQGLIMESPPGPPQVAQSHDQCGHRYALALALRAKSNVARVTQAGMPAQGHNLCPQVTTAQPLVTDPMCRHRGRPGPGASSGSRQQKW